MDRVVERPAALDVHKAQVTACVRTPGEGVGRSQEVRELKTTVRGLLALRDWLAGVGVTTVAMEATGVYWRPVWAVLEDEHALCLAVRLDAHELLDELIKRLDPVLGRAPIEQLGSARVPRGQVAERTLALVLVLDQLAFPARPGRLAGMLARAGLDRRLLIRAHHEIAGLQQFPLPPALVQVQDPTRLLGELRVAREDPRAIVPRANRVLPQPPPDRDRRDRRDDPALDRLPGELSARPARERNALLGRQLACQRLDLGHLRRGKNAAADPAVVAPQARAPLPRRSVFATWRLPGATRAAISL